MATARSTRATNAKRARSAQADLEATPGQRRLSRRRFDDDNNGEGAARAGELWDAETEGGGGKRGVDDGGGEDDDDDESAKETVAEARLRMAKQYLAEVQAELATAAGGAAAEAATGEDARELARRLHDDALEARGYATRRVAADVSRRLGSTAMQPLRTAAPHHLSVTALSLSPNDEHACFSCAKDGSVARTDLETGSFDVLVTYASLVASAQPTQRGPLRGRGRDASALAIHPSGNLLAFAGGDHVVRLWDARGGTVVASMTGHRGRVTGVAFAEDGLNVYSCSADRTVKQWSTSQRSYVDTLYGHTSDVLCIDGCGAGAGVGRVVTGGMDGTTRLWKVADEKQLILRSQGPSVQSRSVDAISSLSSSEWVTGSDDGTLTLWTSTKKKGQRVDMAHEVITPQQPALFGGDAGSASAWVQSVTACPGADLVASGAGDGKVRLWRVGDAGDTLSAEHGGGSGGVAKSKHLVAIPALASVNGFANALAITRDATRLVCGIGQEPRLGRWGRINDASNGVAVYNL
ncbi:U3 snoRNP-associated protein [Pseudoscourfieldia marina]